MEQKKSVWTIILAIIITAIIAGGGVYLWQDQPANEPISYSTAEVSTVSTGTRLFDWTVEGLENMALECGSEHTEGYFKNLVETYKDTSLIHYAFEYNGKSQNPTAWGISLLPNLMGYSSLDEFQNDFNVCAVGGLYPTRMNGDWLLFESSCGSGYSDDSGLPIGCDEVKKVVEPTIEFN
ncbi:MAG: hypothetical protein WCW30_04295 [Candidatus Gracilibacteria bacterium]